MSHEELRDIEAEIALLSAQAGHLLEGSSEKMAVLAELARLYVRQEDVRKETEKLNAFEDAYWDAKREMAASVSAIHMGYRHNVESLFAQLDRDDAEVIIAEREAQIDQMMQDYADVDETILSADQIAALQSSELEIFEAENVVVGVLDEAAQTAYDSLEIEALNAAFDFITEERQSLIDERQKLRELFLKDLRHSECKEGILDCQCMEFKSQAKAFLDEAIKTLNDNEALRSLRIPDKLTRILYAQNHGETVTYNYASPPINFVFPQEDAIAR